MFRRATKEQAKARIALIGPSGSGKTYTALLLASHLGNRIALIDTEHGSASKYADQFEFDVLNLDSFHPQRYIDGIRAAEQAGYDALVIDSLSHAWMGKDGALELVDRSARRYQGNSFAAWRDVTPLHNSLVEAMLRCDMHLIVTMRAKTEYVIQEDEKGRKAPRKVGLAPVQRDGLEYEFDIVGDLDADNTLIITKTRCPALAGAVIAKPGGDVAAVIKDWLSDGVRPAPRPAPAAQPESGSSGEWERANSRLWATARQKGLDDRAVHVLAHKEHGVTSLRSLSPDQLRALASKIAQAKPEQIAQHVAANAAAFDAAMAGESA